jgi:hypothetical protein
VNWDPLAIRGAQQMPDLGAPKPRDADSTSITTDVLVVRSGRDFGAVRRMRPNSPATQCERDRCAHDGPPFSAKPEWIEIVGKRYTYMPTMTLVPVVIGAIRRAIISAGSACRTYGG